MFFLTLVMKKLTHVHALFQLSPTKVQKLQVLHFIKVNNDTQVTTLGLWETGVKRKIKMQELLEVIPVREKERKGKNSQGKTLHCDVGLTLVKGREGSRTGQEDPQTAVQLCAGLS